MPLANNPLRKSITELEYRQARLLNKRCLVFLLDPDAPWPRTLMELGDALIKLDAFRSELMNETTVGFFKSADDLARQAVVAASQRAVSDIGSRTFNNLPRSASSAFVARTSIEKPIRDLLDPNNTTCVVNLHGIGGVGKSEITLHIAHDYATRGVFLSEPERFGAIIWFSAKRQIGIVQSEHQERTLRELLATISITLEREDIVRAPETDQPELAVHALQRQRTLLLLDGFEKVDAGTAAFIRRLPQSTKVIVTSRRRFVDADRTIHVGAMSPDEAALLTTSEAQRRGIEIAADDACDLARVTGWVPVAIVWSIAQIGYGFELRTVMERLRSSGNEVVQFCFEGIIDALRNSAARRLLMALSLFTSDTRKEDVAAVAGMAENSFATDEGFVQLENLSLIIRAGRRVGLLSLTRDLAQIELSRDNENEVYLQRWKARVVNIASAHRPQYWYDFNANAVQPDIVNLRASLHWASDHQDWRFYLSVVSVVCWYDNYAGLWDELIETAEKGATTASTFGDVRVEVELRAALLGFAYSQRGEFDRALRNVETAIAIARERLEQPAALAFALCHLAQVHRKRGDMIIAEERYAEAESLLSDLSPGDRTRIAIQFELGKLARDKQDWEHATALFTDVRRWLDQHPSDPLNQTQLRAAVLGHLALIEFYQENFPAARSDCLEGLTLFSALNLRVAFGPMFWRLAMIEHALGNNDAATEAIAHAITWFSRLGMADDLSRATLLSAQIDAARSSQQAK
jgi:tetratricopeptide (TPR) repeat protein